MASLQNNLDPATKTCLQTVADRMGCIELACGSNYATVVNIAAAEYLHRVSSG